jgi:hypothetical protein
MLYETPARAPQILALDARDPDPPSRQATVAHKGGAIDVAGWQAGVGACCRG